MSKILLAAAVATLALVGGAVTSAEASGHGYGHRGHHGHHHSHHRGHHGHHRHHAYHGHHGHHGHAYRPSYGHGHHGHRFHGHYGPACKAFFDHHKKAWVKVCCHGHHKSVEAPKVVEKAPGHKETPPAEKPPVEEQAPPVETPPSEELK